MAPEEGAVPEELPQVASNEEWPPHRREELEERVAPLRWERVAQVVGWASETARGSQAAVPEASTASPAQRLEKS